MPNMDTIIKEALIINEMDLEVIEPITLHEGIHFDDMDFNEILETLDI